MLLPGFLDLIPERTGKLLANLSGWHPEGKRVTLQVTEGEADFCGTVISGKIISLEHVRRIPADSTETKTTSVLIQLDSPWYYSNRTTNVANRIIAEPRFYGHSVHRLLIGTAYVHVFPVNNESSPFTLNWKDMIAICSMKLD
jgi:hypothetical protein